MGKFQEKCLWEPTQLGASPLVLLLLSSEGQTFHLMAAASGSILDYVIIFRTETLPFTIEQKITFITDGLVKPSLDLLLLHHFYVKEN